MTISDVARHAGVSISTVSYVISGKRSISEQTRRRVEEAIGELGYRPHAGARALASNRSNVIALTLPFREGVGVPVVMQFAVAAVTAARRFDHDVLLLTQAEGEEGLRRVAGTALVDALIVMDVQLEDPRIPLLRSLDRPSVLIGFPADSAGLTCIDLDFLAAGKLCVEYLAGLGHRRLTLIGSPPEVYQRGTAFAPRVADGFMSAVTDRGFDASWHPCEENAEAARALVRRLLAEDPELSGVVLHNEAVVEPVLRAFQDAGRRIPEDLSVVAICPDELAERSSVPLTAVALPATEIGEQAVTLLMAKLEDREVPDATLLPPHLTIRASTA